MVEDNLITNEPVQAAGNGALCKLDDIVCDAAWARIDRSDGSGFALGGIARMDDGHQVGKGNRDGFASGGGGFRMPGANAVLDALN